MMAVEEISAGEAAARRETAPPGECILLDVREDDELRLARIDGALHIPMHDIPQRMGEIDRRKEVIAFCHRGQRSFKVAAFLKQQGFPTVKSMTGGIDAWSLEVDPTIPRY